MLATPAIPVAVFAKYPERLAALQDLIESTRAAHVVFTHAGFPLRTTDALIREMQAHRAEVVVVDVNPEDPRGAILAVEFIKDTCEIGIFAVGDTRNRHEIIATMRAGAKEFLDLEDSVDAFRDAFTRFSVARSKARTAGQARVFTVINAKGGSGATTVAVNTAVALQAHGPTILVDFAPVGHAALHLNVRPSYSALDALEYLHRLDEAMLESLVTTATNGLHLLGGPTRHTEVKASNAELARLFNLLETQYRYVVVDCSGHFDAMSRLLADLSNRILMVAQNDLVSLWSAGRIHEILQQGNVRVGLVMNRYRKRADFGERDIENETRCDLLWKLPSDYESVIEAIDKGVPVVTQAKKEIGRSFRALAELLIADGHGGAPGGSSPPLVPAPIPGGPSLRPYASRRAAWES